MKRVMLAALAIFVVLLSLTFTFAQDAAPTVAPETAPPAQATSAPAPRPLPVSVVTQGASTLELYFENLPQGQAKLARVYGQNVVGARGRFLDRVIDFFPTSDGYYALLVANMEQNARSYELSVFITYADGTSETISAPVEVVTGSFVRQEVTIAPDKAYLVDPEVERSEIARLESVFEPVTPEALWAGGFQLPIAGELTSAFGAFRVINESVTTRHTGWDIRAGLGIPIMASGAGRVAFAGPMEIRGNFVAIDHGYGIYSTYSHMSQVHVTRGQSITRGQIIGMVGDTGRTSGPHFHWEFAVAGEWVDPVEMVNMWMPSVS